MLQDYSRTSPAGDLLPKGSWPTGTNQLLQGLAVALFCIIVLCSGTFECYPDCTEYFPQVQLFVELLS